MEAEQLREERDQAQGTAGRLAALCRGLENRVRVQATKIQELRTAKETTTLEMDVVWTHYTEMHTEFSREVETVRVELERRSTIFEREFSKASQAYRDAHKEAESAKGHLHNCRLMLTQAEQRVRELTADFDKSNSTNHALRCQIIENERDIGGTYQKVGAAGGKVRASRGGGG